MPAIAFLVVSFLCGFEITKRMKVNICGQIAAGIGSGYLMVRIDYKTYESKYLGANRSRHWHWLSDIRMDCIYRIILFKSSTWVDTS